ncbi:phage tail fibers [Yersinia frederiksenii]|nr:phage tail fibers [Yersinia frederiksenii]CNI03857.1 phage tail fibers [Yersinia frederiksenii]
MTDRLLPVGSSVLEVAAARACAELENTPVPIRQLWNADTCPLPLLPYLAWAWSVAGKDEAETTSNIIGGADENGRYTGMKALLTVQWPPLKPGDCCLSSRAAVSLPVVNPFRK